MRRRDFLPALALGGPSLAAGAQSSAAGSQPRPKIGSVSWNFHSLAPGAHPEEAIDIIGSLGFDGIELIANSRQDIDDYWTDATIGRIKRRLEQRRLVLSQFPFFQPVVEGLTSRDVEERKRSLAYFERGCRIAKKLGAPMVNIVAPWARELSTPSTTYLPRYFMGDPKPGEKFRINIGRGYDFDELWHLFTQTMKDCLNIAKSQGMTFSIENHTHTMMPGTDSFLRLWDAIRDPALGCNLDCGWAMNQREYPPAAMHKLSKRLVNLHVRDIDAPMRKFVAIGQGVMDFAAIADAVRAVGFSGFLTLEQDGSGEDMKETCRRYVRLMRQLLS